MLGDSAVFANRHGGKGLAKGAIKGVGKNKPKFLAIEDDKKDPKPPKSDEKLIDEALSKAKKMRDLAFSTVANYEDAMNAVKHSKFWSKAANKDALAGLQELQEAADSLKKFTSKLILDLDLIKGKIMDCGLGVKKATSSIK
jgi:hypothetical protein